MTDLPRSAQIIVIGGGIVGCSVAYHLAKRGVETLLLERHQLSSGSTWHAAGLIGQLRTNANITQLLGYSVELYDRLEAETGYATGWRRNGGLRLACNADRWIEVKRQATSARSFGLEMQLLSAKEAQALWPLMNVDDVVGAAFLPTDGQANPSDITQALAKGARLAGAKLRRGRRRHGRSSSRTVASRGVVTNRGPSPARSSSLCAGLWTQPLAARAGVAVPLSAVHHQYHRDREDRRRDQRSADAARSGSAHLLQGGGRRPRHGRLSSPNPMPWTSAPSPRTSPFGCSPTTGTISSRSWTSRWAACRRSARPASRQMINGLESFTPDGNCMIGEAPEVRNFFVGAGFNAFGIASAGGAGMALAEWVADGEPPFDLWPVDIRRFGAPHRTRAWVRARTLEAYARHYTHRLAASRGVRTGRPLRRSPLYDRLKARGACFGEKMGFERPNWFADGSAAKTPDDRYSFGGRGLVRCGRARASRLPRGRGALRSDSLRQGAVVGPRRRGGAVLDRRQRCRQAARRASTYTQMLNRKGGIECDLTDHATGARPFLYRDRHRLRHARLRLDQAIDSRRHGRDVDRRHLGAMPCWR